MRSMMSRHCYCKASLFVAEVWGRGLHLRHALGNLSGNQVGHSLSAAEVRSQGFLAYDIERDAHDLFKRTRKAKVLISAGIGSRPILFVLLLFKEVSFEPGFRVNNNQALVRDLFNITFTSRSLEIRLILK
ncbi:hypothetical protein CEXT_297971 [Caerostris extrusa]|uniref:Uncharacterized protein n=1 Tax=Caerostris extrusa TaxID=172846 RepID=A0AAV4XPF5_CAEEX|nr:hypothetical protein CEXT_297971 [Caerostris extrusa]